LQENIRNLLENQAALIYCNIGTGKLRATLSHVTYESDTWEIQFRRKKQNFDIVQYSYEGRKAGSNGMSIEKLRHSLPGLVKVEGSFTALYH